MSAKLRDLSQSARKKYFRPIDIIVLVVFLSTAVYGLYLFRQDLMQTLDSRGLEPVGTIVIKQNVVQRRHEDRAIWDRLFVESPVYSGDLIRVAELSAAAIFIEKNQLNVNENTIIRIQSAGARGSVEVELQEGNLSLESSEDSAALLLNLMGNQVQASQGTVLNADVSREGMSVQVNEGSAAFIEEGQTRELAEGTMVAKDSKGVERKIPAAVVSRPRPNARYLKHSDQPLLVNFSWKRINLSAEENLSLEISADKSFLNGIISIDNLDSSALAAFDTGVWYWRITFESAVLGKGEITVIDSSGPQLLSPVTGSVFRYSDALPQVRFQWSERQWASHYILEVSRTPEFLALQLNKRISSSSYIQSRMGEGTWYWRVKPIFSSAYEGSSEYSRVASFKIERTAASQSASIEIPESEVIAAIMAGLPAQKTSAPEAYSTVVPTLTRNRAPQRAPQRGTYTVKPGDTLARIAGELYGDPALYTRIVETNNIANPDLIFPDQVFIIP